MSMVLTDEQGMLQNAAREFFTQTLPISAFRASRDQHNWVAYNSDAWQQMIELGWSSILLPQSLDGLGFGITGMGVIAIEAGKSLAVSPLQNTATLCVQALLQTKQNEFRDQILADIASGDSVPTIAQTSGVKLQKNGDGWMLSGNLDFVSEAMAASCVLLVIGHDDPAANVPRCIRVEFSQAGVSRQQVSLIDRRDYAIVQFANVEIKPSQMFAPQDASSFVQGVNDIGAIMTACELFGITQEAFQRTLAYLKEREQFGQKIGAFQALQHRMAAAYMQIELFKSVLYDALDAIECQRDDAAQAISHAKIMANDVSQLVCTEAIQMHGGMGITDELDIGLFYKRARVLRTVYGSTSEHKQRFAALNDY